MFAPKGIAIVGASDRSGWSSYTLANLRRPATRTRSTWSTRRGGLLTASWASDRWPNDGVVELAYILTGPSSLPSIMTEAAERGIANVVVIAAGIR